MKAGTYFIGDLCYVMTDEEWDECCSGVIEQDIYKFSDGRCFAIFHTEYGDGSYHDNYMNIYPVDSGSIGCILLNDITDKSVLMRGDIGTFITFTKDFTPYAEDGDIHFGHICINTEDSYIEHDDFDDELTFK